MFRLNRTKITITLVVAIFLIAQTGLTQEVISQQKSLRDVTPDKPLIFFQLTGASSLIIKDSNFCKQLEQAPFLELLYAELEVSSKVKNVHLAIEPGVSLLSYIFGEDIVFVLPRFEALTEVSPLLMLRLKSDDALGSIIASSIKIALANVAETTSQYRGYTIASIPLPEGDLPLGLSCALLDDVFAVGLGDTTLKKVINLMNNPESTKSIATGAEFSSIMERLALPDNSKTGQYLTVCHLDLAQIVTFGSMFYMLAQENIPQEVRPIVQEALKWLDLVPSISSASAIADDGLVGQGYMALNPDATSQNFLKMLQVEPEQLGSMKFVPEDAIGYSGTNLIDLKLIHKMALDTLAGFPEIGEQVLGQLEQLEQGLQFDIEEGLLSWMGNEIGFIYNENPNFSEQYISKKIALLIEVTDLEKAEQGMKDFTAIGTRRSKDQMTIQEREYEGETIYELGHLPVELNPCYALVDDYLLISPSVSYLQKLIDCAAGRQKDLSANPRFQSVKDRMPEKVNLLEFLDAHNFTSALTDSIKTQMQPEMPTWEYEKLDLPETLIIQAFELADVLGQAWETSIEFTVNDGAGLRSYAFVQIEDLETVVPITDPDAAKIARNLHIADRYMEADMLDRALPRYEQVLELDEGNYQALMSTAQIFKKQGKVHQSEKSLALTGFVPEDSWYVVGPFENEMAEGFYTEFPPEEGFQIDAEYESSEGPVKWEKRSDKTLDGFVNFKQMFMPEEWAVAYAWTKVISKESREVELRIGSDDQIKIWLNGEEVFGHEIPRVAQPDQDVITVTLDQGENQLLVKVCNEEMNWGFYLRITDADGKPLKGLKYGK